MYIFTVKDTKLILLHQPLAPATGSEELAVQRSRSDSSPAGSSAAALFAEGNAHLSKRWKSWSAFPQSLYGIPLGSLTAREAAKPFWNTDMLQKRMEKIAECAALEAASSDDEIESEHDDLRNYRQNSNLLSDTQLETERQSGILFSDDESGSSSASDDDNSLGIETVAPAQLDTASQRHDAVADNYCKVEHSVSGDGLKTTGSCKVNEGLVVITSAPLLDQRDNESFPVTTIFSKSEHIL